MDIEAVVLSGGASRRMGQDKASMRVDGETALERTVRLLQSVAAKVTVLGPQGIPDEAPYEGPLAAIAGFDPQCDFVFLASCDMPRFEPAIVPLLRSLCASHDAAIPELQGRLQPLCGLYRDYAIDRAHDLAIAGLDRLMGWVDTLDVRHVGESELLAEGLDPLQFRSANTPEEWAALLKQSLL